MLGRLLVIVSFYFLLASCASVGSQTLEEMDYPLNLLQKVAASISPAGLKKVSVNQREISSNYFIPDSSEVKFWSKASESDRVRYQSKITILGDRRPYDIVIEVFKEKYTKSWVSSKPRFEKVGGSSSLATEVSEYYQNTLTKALKDRNFIDDFRVF